MKKFFNLPILQTYVVLLILLITIIFGVTNLIKSTLLYFMPNPQTQMEKYSPVKSELDNRIVLTDEANKYYLSYVDEINSNGSKRNNIKEIINTGLGLLIAFPFFYLYWRRSKKLDEDNDIQFTVKNFYFYIVCTITFFIAFFSSQSAINTIVDFNYPNNYVISINELTAQIADKNLTKQNADTPVNIDKAMLKKAIEERQNMESSWRYDSIVQSITSIIVAIPVFFLHWRPIRRLGIIE